MRKKPIQLEIIWEQIETKDASARLRLAFEMLFGVNLTEATKDEINIDKPPQVNKDRGNPLQSSLRK